MSRFDQSDEEFARSRAPAPPPDDDFRTMPMLERPRLESVQALARQVEELRYEIMAMTGEDMLEGIVCDPRLVTFIRHGMAGAERYAPAADPDGVMIHTLSDVPIHTKRQLEKDAYRAGYEDAVKALTIAAKGRMK